MTVSEREDSSCCPPKLPVPAPDATDADRVKFWKSEAERAFWFRKEARAARAAASAESQGLKHRLNEIQRVVGALRKGLSEETEKRIALEREGEHIDRLKRDLWELWSGIDQEAHPEVKRQLWEFWSRL